MAISNLADVRKNAAERVLTLLRSGAYDYMTAQEIADKAQVPDTICKDRQKFVHNICMRFGYKKHPNKDPLKHRRELETAEVEAGGAAVAKKRNGNGKRRNRSGPRLFEGRRALFIKMVKDGATSYQLRKQFGFKNKWQIYRKLMSLRYNGHWKSPIPDQFKSSYVPVRQRPTKAAKQPVENKQPAMHEIRTADLISAVERLVTLRAIELLEEMLKEKKASLEK